MPSEPTVSDLIPLRQIPKLKLIPARRNGTKLNYATIWRWVNHGVHGVKLRTLRIGSQPVTTKEWLFEFFEALTESYSPGTSAPSPRRRRSAERAGKQLEALGV
jgi:hypothetical protein